MPMRLSGLMSGMDTESIIEQLVAARRTKVDDAKKAQTKLQWTQDAWKTLNAKIKKLYDGALSNLRFETSYMKKTTKVSNSNVVSVITGEGAMNSVQSLEVSQMAQSGYLTGGQLGDGKKGYTADTTLGEMGIDLETASGVIKVNVGGEEKEITVTRATTLGELVNSFKEAGLNASFDANNQRFYLASKNTGTENDFSVYSEDENGIALLNQLGLGYVDAATEKKYQDWADRIAGSLDQRLEDQLSQLTARKSSLEALQQDRLTALSNRFGSELGGIDISAANIAEVKQKVSELYAAHPGDAAYADLADWETEWDTTAAELTDITTNRLEDSGGGTLKLTAEEQEKVQEQVNAEKAEVEQMLADLKAAQASSGATKNEAKDAKISLNGVEYTGSTNTFAINGLTLTINSTTAKGETVTLSTQDDTDGVYDMIKNFFKEYNELINEMDKLYNAESARGYEPLTDEEKDAMSDSEVEEWEKKIKDALLRRDSTLGTVSTAIKQVMMSGVMVNGKQMYLSNFGIETLSYFTAAENEKNAYHIDGDADDANTSGNADKLRSMIASDPQSVVDFFVGLSRNLYSELTDRMARTEYSSSYTVYEDVRMKKEYDDYTSKIKDLEDKLADYEDKWYAKFADMETAMAQMQKNASAVTALLGG